MSISCADDKSKPPIKIRPRVEIAHCMNYMIKSAWHSVTALKSAFGHERTLQALVDHLVSARNECGGYGQTERLRGSEIDDHLKYGWLLNRQVGRLGALQDLVNVHGSLAIQVGKFCGVRPPPAFPGDPPRHGNRRHMMLQRQLGGAFAGQAGLNDDGIRPLLLHRGESALELLSAADPDGVDR